MQENQNSVLIAEEDLPTAENLQNILITNGYQVVGYAGDGPTAVRLAQTLKPALIFMGCELPIMSGSDAAKTILATAPTILIAIIKDDNATPEQVLAAGFNAYLKAPANASVLLPTITLARHQYAERLEQQRLQMLIQKENLKSKLAEEKIAFLSRTQALVSQISTRLVTAKNTEGIALSLTEIANFANADYCFAFGADPKNAQKHSVLEWHRDTVPPLQDAINQLRLHAFPWIKLFCQHGEVPYLSNSQGLPAVATAEKAILNELGLKTILVIPVLHKEKIQGALVVASRRDDIYWPPTFVPPLKLAAEIILGTMEYLSTTSELQEIQHRHLAILQAFPDIMFLHDQNGIFLDYYTSSPEILLTTPNHFIGKSFREVLPGHVSEKAEKAFEKASNEKNLQKFEYSLEIDGALHHFEARIVPCGQDKIINIIRNITDIRQAELDRLALQDKLHEAQQDAALRHISSAIANNFNNLLTVILGNADLAAKSTTGPTLGFLEEIKKSAQQSALLTSQILAYSGGQAPELQELNIQDIILKAIDQTQNDKPFDKIEHVDMLDQLPTIKGDADQLTQVVTNLLINAWEATESTPRTVKIITGKRYLDRPTLAQLQLGDRLSDGNYVYFTISDNGPGITEEDRKHLFNPFFSTKAPSRGLGLPVVFGTVNTHYGCLEVNSSPNQGTAFTIYLPVAEENEPAAPLPAKETLAPRTILVIDDEANIRIITRRILESAGYKTLAATRGVEGLLQCQTYPDAIDAVLLDTNMPGWNGLETYRRIRAVRANLPIIFFSGYSEREVASILENDKHTGFLQKPYEVNDLIGKINHLVHHP